MARRTYSLDDQRAFAALSGDWNPLHVDPTTARRTLFGHPLVHGIHLVLWGLDEWLAASTGPVQLVELAVAWRKPAPVGVPLDLEVTGTDEVKLVARAGDLRVMDATVRWRAVDAVAGAPAPAAWPREPLDVPADQLAGRRGELDTGVQLDAAAARFPHAVARLGGLAIGELLALTRLVGMTCPGLHSVFGGIALRARAGDAPVIAYEVARAVPKVSLVEIAVRGPRFEGTLETFARPRPRPGPTDDELARAIEPGEFAGQTALVIGGSRGIGEAIARALAFGGAEVSATYHRGADDADRVARASGGRIVFAPLDVTQPFELDDILRLDVPATHLYYLATPRIPSGRFVAADLHELLRHDVDGLYAVATAAVARWGGSLVVWTPSSALLDTGSGNASIALSKAAMEELCRRLPGLPRANVHAPRLPRLATDQTAALVELPAKPVLEVVLPELRRIHRR